MTEGVEIIAGQPETILVEVGLPGPPGAPGTDTFDIDLALLYQIAKL